MAFKPRDERTKRERLKDYATNRDAAMSDLDFKITLDQLLEEAWANGWEKRDIDMYSSEFHDNPYRPNLYGDR